MKTETRPFLSATITESHNLATVGDLVDFLKTFPAETALQSGFCMGVSVSVHAKSDEMERQYIAFEEADTSDEDDEDDDEEDDSNEVPFFVW